MRISDANHSAISRAGLRAAVEAGTTAHPDNSPWDVVAIRDGLVGVNSVAGIDSWDLLGGLIGRRTRRSATATIAWDYRSHRLLSPQHVDPERPIVAATAGPRVPLTCAPLYDVEIPI